ncbi:thioesterase, FlK family [Anderseniella sp. Alg231-50]|uniref:thioesterase, FlK family n=1 Tax=Anderseniella sp. Alg231-50 TaxID=1922226 RepID=UPI000D557BB2
MKPAAPGISYTGQVHSKPSDLASALGNTGVDVVSSPATIGYLEMACCYAMDQLFEEGEASVGVGFDMQHVGAATPDLPVDLAAELIRVDGRRLTFTVEATQAGKQIMTGTHQRAVVNLARLIAGTAVPDAPDTALRLTGRGLKISDVEAVAVDGRRVEIADECRERMADGRAIVERYFADNTPAYGLNTGLGVRATDMLSVEEAAEFSAKMVRGRAQAIGQPLPVPAVRAAMLVRLNTVLSGAAGASLAVADALRDALNSGVTPVMPATGSIGAGDLVIMAAVPHALMGEGDAFFDGGRMPGSDALKKAGLEPLMLGPKDGLVLCNNQAHSASLACLAALSARAALDAANISAALVMEGFRANVSPLSSAAAGIRPQAGQVETAKAFRDLLEGSALMQDGAARRLQDPISLRSVIQTHGAVHAALDVLEAALDVEINHAPDNPAVLVGENRIVSTGNYHTPWLSQALDVTARSLAVLANDAVARIHRLCTPEMSGLAPLLSSAATDRAGFGPLLKPVEAVRANIIHLANPVPVIPSFNAGGVEDAATFTPLAASKLMQLCEQLSYLLAYELLAGAQALDLAGPAGVAPRIATAHEQVRALSGFLDDDRPIGREVEAVACELVLMGRLAKQVYR